MKRNALISALPPTIILGVAFGMTWMFFVVFVYSFVSNMSGEILSHTSHNYMVYNDGSVEIYDASYSWASLQTEESKPYEIFEGPFRDEAEPDSQKIRSPYAWGSGWTPPDTETGRNSWSSRIICFSDSPNSASWYFIHDGEAYGKSYFVGYDTKTNHRLGYIGRNGFQENKPSNETCFSSDRRISFATCSLTPAENVVNHFQVGAFSQPQPVAQKVPAEPIYLASGDDIYRIDVTDGSVKKFTTVEGLVSISIARYWGKGAFGQPTILLNEYGLAARTQDRLQCIDVKSGEKTIDIAIPEDFQKESCSVYNQQDGTCILASGDNSREGYTFFWLDADGQVVQNEHVDFPRHEEDMDMEIEMVRTSCAAFPVPAVIIPLMIFVFPQEYMNQSQSKSWQESFGMMLTILWPLLLGMIVLSGGLSWRCVKHQRKYHQKYVWSWAVFVFLFGLPAYMGYRLHRRWPVLDPCPTCGANVPRDREKCSACDAAFPEPELKGTEVFA
jgi:hypothetical protein